MGNGLLAVSRHCRLGLRGHETPGMTTVFPAKGGANQERGPTLTRGKAEPVLRRRPSSSPQTMTHSDAHVWPAASVTCSLVL